MCECVCQCVRVWDDNKHSVNMLTQKLAYSYDDGNEAFSLTAYQLWVIITHTPTQDTLTHTHTHGDKPGVVDFIGVHVILSQVLTTLSRVQHMPNGSALLCPLANRK